MPEDVGLISQHTTSSQLEYFGKAVVDENGSVFNSLTLAANHYKITVEAVRYRIKIGRYKYLNQEN